MKAKKVKGPTIYKVVINHEEQYAVVPADQANKRGWKDTGKTGTERACLAYSKAASARSRGDVRSRVVRPGATPGLLFDLTEPDLVAALTRYAPKASLRRARAMLSAPFRVDRFPDLVREVGPDAAPKVLAGLWAQARLGVTPDALARHFTAEMERYAGLWDAKEQDVRETARPGALRLAGGPVRCGQAVTEDSGAFRVKVNATRISAVILSYGSIRVDHYKRNSNGKYKDEKADRLEVQATVFIGAAGGPIDAIPISKVEQHAKKARASFTYGGFAEVPFVEGCGGVSAGSPLWACACSGNRPGDGGSGGGFGGGGSGGIDDGG